MFTKKICVIGLGYIGLPTAALLANRGYSVYGVDVVKKVVDTINSGNIHIVEPELDIYVKAAVNSGKLKASLQPVKADIFIIAVPTPFKENYLPNIGYVIEAAEAISKFVEEGNIIILESTVPIGTTQEVEKTLQENNIDTSKIYISHCPERVLPGHIIKELVENDRIVGGITPEATLKTIEFYKTFVEGEILSTDAKTAELAKLAENSFRDLNIAFANELSILCDKFGINVWELIELTNKHPRVDILNPGVGVGGHCIAVDPWFIVHAGGEDTKLIKTARTVNMYKTKWVFKKIKNVALQYENEKKKKPIIACLGVSFKPNIDDLRESPALEVVIKLINEGFQVVVAEPNIKSSNQINLVDYKKAIKDADIIVYLVAHKEFLDLQISNKQVISFCETYQN